jgi:cell division protein FtsB
MSRRQKKTKPELVKANQELMILDNQLPQQELARKNRLLLVLVLSLTVMVFVLSSFLLPAHEMVEDLKQKQVVEAATVSENLKNPVLADEITQLKGQLVGLVSGSIEGKLNSLEKSIKLGSVLGSLETVRSLKEDLKVLKTYSDPLEQKKQQTAMANEMLVKEVSQLKNMIYLTLGSCGLMFAALAGIWIKGRKQLISQSSPYLEKKN